MWRWRMSVTHEGAAKIAVSVATTVLLAGILMTTALGQEGDKDLASAVGRSKSRGFEGVVVSVDPTSKTLVVRGQRGVTTFRLDYARFRDRFGVPGQVASELRVGDTVAVRYGIVRGIRYATVIGKK